MASLINIDEIIDKIKSKINNGNFDFNNNEISYIINDYKLFELFIDKLTKDYNSWNNASQQVYDYFAHNYEVDFSYEVRKNYVFSLIDKGTIGSVLEGTYIDEKFFKEIKEYLKEKLLNPSNVYSNIHAGKELLKLIVELKRMDLLNNIIYLNEIYPDTLEELKKYYANNELPIPDAILFYLKDFKCSLNRLSLNSILKYLEVSSDVLNEYNYSIFLNKLKQSDLKNANSFIWDNIFLKLTDAQKEEVLTIILEKGYYEILSQLSFINEDMIDKYIHKYIYSVTINKNFESNIKDFKNSSYIHLLNNENVLQTLIKEGKLLTASYSPKFNKYLDIVIKEIENNPELFKKININKFNNLQLYPDLIYALWLAGVSNVNSYIKNMPELKEKIINSILSGKINNIPSSLINNELINKLIINGYPEIVVESSFIFNSSSDLVFSEESIKILVEKFKQNKDFAMKLLYSNPNLIINNEKLLCFFLNGNDQAREILINKINHLEEDKAKYSNEMFDLVKDFLQEKYQLNPENFEQFEKYFGPLIIRYANNENIQQIINIKREDFDKFLKIFPKIDFNMVDVEKIYDSLKQFEFSRVHSEDIETFARINHLIVDNDEAYFQEFDKIVSIFEKEEDKIKFLKKFILGYPDLSENFKNNPKEFLVDLVEHIQRGTIEEKNYYQNVLHFITDYYIAYRREEYRENSNMNEDLTVPYYLDDKDKIKQVIKCSAIRVHKKLIILEMTDIGISESLASDCIDYYAYDKKDFSKERLIEIKEHIKTLIEIANKILKITGIPTSTVDILDSENKIKRKYYVESNEKNLYAILSELNVETIKDTILNNADVYESLLACMSKYKVHLIPDYFANLMSNNYIDINLEVSDVANFISFYANVYEEEVKRLKTQGKDASEISLNFISILKYAEAYSTTSNIYNQILGVEDARIIKRNPGPNAATRKTKGKDRLDESINWTINNYRRIEVTIPTFNEVLNHKEKSIRAIVGNLTHPSTITLGERTGSCMRIGGAGDTLFEFILSDKNGFHIRFENPETGELISRVSGFRNGNTVFLNELRCSCNPDEYLDAEIFEFCKIVANKLIEKSNESTCRIENVVLHNAYATEKLGLKEEYLNIEDNRIGLKNFYSDIKDKAIILASIKTPFAKIDFDKSKVPSYRPARELTYKSEDTIKLRSYINRVHAVNCALKGMNYKYIEPLEIKKDIYYGIANQDFYIFIDIDGNIFEEIIEIDDRALIELEEARRIIQSIREQENLNMKRN